MRTLRFFVDFDKEEAWLNAMAADGHLVTSTGPVYSFAPVTPGGAVVRIDYRPSMRRVDYDDYVSLFADAGWRHLAGARSGGPQYFASVAPRPDAEIFSDPHSKAQRYRRSIANRSALLLLLLTFVLALTNQGTLGADVLASPRDWYLTPGLWDLQGADFVAAFLFETPFVLLRVGGPILLAAGGVVGAVQLAQQCVLYRRATASRRGSSTSDRAQG